MTAAGPHDRDGWPIVPEARVTVAPRETPDGLRAKGFSGRVLRIVDAERGVLELRDQRGLMRTVLAADCRVQRSTREQRERDVRAIERRRAQAEATRRARADRRRR